MTYQSNLRDLAARLQSTTVLRSFVIGLFMAQYFEVQLREIYESTVKIISYRIRTGVIKYQPALPDNSTSKTIVDRIQNFYPRVQYPKVYNAIDAAINKRNHFIHSAFNFKDLKKDFNFEDFHLSAEARKSLTDWLKSFEIASIHLSQLRAIIESDLKLSIKERLELEKKI